MLVCVLSHAPSHDTHLLRIRLFMVPRIVSFRQTESISDCRFALSFLSSVAKPKMTLEGEAGLCRKGQRGLPIQLLLSSLCCYRLAFSFFCYRCTIASGFQNLILMKKCVSALDEKQLSLDRTRRGGLHLAYLQFQKLLIYKCISFIKFNLYFWYLDLRRVSS